MNIRGTQAMKAEGARFAHTLAPEERGATLVALSGELGAGKTTFVQGLAEALGVRETVTSPTFVIEKIYRLEHQKWQRLVHIDAYRLEGAHELDALGFGELLGDAHSLILIEWPERVSERIGESAQRIHLRGSGEEREVVYS